MSQTTRFDLARRCDSIQTADKLVPLKIKTLVFEPMKTIINNKSYQVGVYRKFHDKKHDQFYILEGTETGGTLYDLDRFGFRETSEEQKVTPGDVNLQFKPLPDKPTVEESKQRIRDNKSSLGMLRNHNSRDPSVTDQSRRMSGKVLPDSYHVKGETPPYNSYILLTMKNGDSEEKEYVGYTKTLQEASKYLNTWIFDGRPAIQVKKLEVKSARMTIRLPSDIKIHAQIVRIHRHVYRTLDNLSTVIANSSFPLKTIEIFNSERIYEDFTHKNIEEVGKLVIFLHSLEARFPIDTKWNMLPPRTHFVSEGLSNDDFPAIIKSWKASKQQIGTWFSVGYRSQSNVTWAMQELAKKLKVKEKFRAVLIPIDATRQIKVDYEKVDHMEYESYGASHILNMKIVEKL